MKLSAIAEWDSRLRELVPPSTGAAPAPGAPGAPAPTGATTLKPGQQIQQDPAAMAKMAAQQALDKQNQKKELQDQIKQKQEELADLNKQLAAIK
jgi:hypothetical protein